MWVSVKKAPVRVCRACRWASMDLPYHGSLPADSPPPTCLPHPRGPHDTLTWLSWTSTSYSCPFVGLSLLRETPPVEIPHTIQTDHKKSLNSNYIKPQPTFCQEHPARPHRLTFSRPLFIQPSFLQFHSFLNLIYPEVTNLKVPSNPLHEDNHTYL